MLLSGISTCFQVVSQSLGQIAHVLLTHPPLASNKSSRRNLWIQLARLACIRHAASVRPEPGSNSQFENWVFLICSRLFACELTSLICLDQTMFDPHTAKLCSVFKVPTCVLVTQRFISYSLVDSLSTSFLIFSFPCLRQIPSSPRQQILVYSLFLKGQISLFIRFIIDTAGRVVIGRGLVSFGNIKTSSHFHFISAFFVRKRWIFNWYFF